MPKRLLQDHEERAAYVEKTPTLYVGSRWDFSCNAVFFNQCARHTLEYMKICSGRTITKRHRLQAKIFILEICTICNCCYQNYSGWIRMADATTSTQSQS